MATRLSRQSALPEACRPLVEPGSFAAGIVHLGLGAFHRAHQAVYTEAAMARSGGDWGIVGVAPRSYSVLAALSEQDYLFSVVTLSQSLAGTRAVAAMSGGVHAGSNPAGVIKLLADPAIKVVTLTVTEKAYRPESEMMRLLVAGLRVRCGAPVTILSCDNLPSNGRVLEGVVRGLAPELSHVTFPSCMVDRIVPATTQSTLDRAVADMGYADLAAVAAEPFLQWVIEDDFAAGRPDWPAQFTGDVTPWEHMKLRALNGVHSALAYLGALAGCTYIWEALRLPGMAELLRQYVATEVAVSFDPPDGEDVVAYGESVLNRFANAELGHKTLQVAMDGTQKLPQRLLCVLNTVPNPRLATLIAAAWAEFAASDTQPLDDPLADVIKADASTEALFGEAGLLPVHDAQRRAMIDGWRREIAKHGPAEVVRVA
ncbi:mannitol dehydrogenase family protein [Allorhizocola rhizosphaerae]|uniref:mannitol dehydrogenase family protein n=1 Tax=Allorhizocola rhizosphaerae TaxID=1872709 RepID=UPI000E3B8385|nr:mannitol dehydrogenase family protein [Allorhizocola rhizosphaerae]